MNMHKPPAFQFYAQDWLASIDISLMTLAEEGAYHRLLCWAWTQEDCGLPADDESLANLSRLGEGWIDSKVKILKKFRRDGSRLFNDRLLIERRKQEDFRKKASAAGKASAIKRFGNARSTHVEQTRNKRSTLQSSYIAVSKNGGISTDQVKRKPTATMPPPETATVRTTLNTMLGKHGLPQFDESAAIRLVRAMPERAADVIVRMCEEKLGQNRDAILSGKIHNVVGFLIRTVPKMAEVG